MVTGSATGAGLHSQAFNEESDSAIKYSKYDLLSLRVQMDRYTGKVYRNHYWLVAQEQGNGTFDMHLVAARWLYSKATYRSVNPYQGQGSSILAQNVSLNDALDMIADFNYKAQELEKRTRYDSRPVKTWYPRREWVSRLFTGTKTKAKPAGIILLNNDGTAPEVIPANQRIASQPAGQTIEMKAIPGN